MAASVQNQDFETIYLEKKKEMLTKPNILFWIERSKNKNVVVYEAQRDEQGELLKASEPITGFWLDIDPPVLKKKWSQGDFNVKSDLNYLDKKLAYGCVGRHFLFCRGIFDLLLIEQFLDGNDERRQAVQGEIGVAPRSRGFASA